MIRVDIIFDELINKVRKTQVLFESNRVMSHKSTYIDKTKIK